MMLGLGFDLTISKLNFISTNCTSERPDDGAQNIQVDPQCPRRDYRVWWARGLWRVAGGWISSCRVSKL